VALQHGPEFAAASAAGLLGGQAAVCIFCLVYGYTALRFGWLVSSLTGITAFFAAIFVLNLFTLTLPLAFVISMAVVLIVFLLLPRSGGEFKELVLPRWDLPLRMLLAAVFVYLVTGFANALGPQLSGLVAPFPVFGLIMSIFTHKQNGSAAALNHFRSYVSASAGYAVFFLIVGLGITTLGTGLTYSLALAAVTCLNGLTLYFLRKNPLVSAG